MAVRTMANTFLESLSEDPMPALEPPREDSMAALTISHAQSGLAVMLLSTIARTSEGFELIALLTEAASPEQLLSPAEIKPAESIPRMAPMAANWMDFFMVERVFEKLKTGRRERAAGIEPACLTWKDSALPLSYARVVGRTLPARSAHLQAFFWISGRSNGMSSWLEKVMMDHSAHFGSFIRGRFLIDLSGDRRTPSPLQSSDKDLLQAL